MTLFNGLSSLLFLMVFLISSGAYAEEIKKQIIDNELRVIFGEEYQLKAQEYIGYPQDKHIQKDITPSSCYEFVCEMEQPEMKGTVMDYHMADLRLGRCDFVGAMRFVKDSETSYWPKIQLAKYLFDNLDLFYTRRPNQTIFSQFNPECDIIEISPYYINLETNLPCEEGGMYSGGHYSLKIMARGDFDNDGVEDLLVEFSEDQKMATLFYKSAILLSKTSADSKIKNQNLGAYLEDSGYCQDG